MANIPSTLIVKVLDPANFSLAEAEFWRQANYYQREPNFYKPYLHPTYANLSYKFGNLPIQYLRIKMENMDKDLRLFERVMKKYQFNLQGEEDENAEKQQPITAGPCNRRERSLPDPQDKAGPSKKRPRPMVLISDTEDDDSDVVEVPAPPRPAPDDKMESQLF